MKTQFKLWKPGLMVIIFLFTGISMAQTDLGVAREKTPDSAENIVEMEERKALIEDAERAKEAFIRNNKNIAAMFEKSAGYAIFPNVGKGAYVLGGAAGNGVVYQDKERIGFAELRQIDIGFQIGGQAFREVIFFETLAALERFKEGNFEFEGNASAVLIEEGKSKSINFQDGIAVATMPKAGAMIGISVGGQKFNYGAEKRN